MRNFTILRAVMSASRRQALVEAPAKTPNSSTLRAATSASKPLSADPSRTEHMSLHASNLQQGCRVRPAPIRSRMEMCTAALRVQQVSAPILQWPMEHLDCRSSSLIREHSLTWEHPTKCSTALCCNLLKLLKWQHAGFVSHQSRKCHRQSLPCRDAKFRTVACYQHITELKEQRSSLAHPISTTCTAPASSGTLMLVAKGIAPHSKCPATYMELTARMRSRFLHFCLALQVGSLAAPATPVIRA
mmetsp:Transcript_138849/g.258925  ORF Transcript_138849/g.258925 Transcript_138849/m.258925 type:complete len:245 (+) Transcript_138849:568-1302(+)